MSDRIYPIPVKQPSGITTWGQWPADVEPLLKRWNRGKGLRFGGGGVFKCDDCAEFCTQPLRAELRGQPLCDDCLIQRGRWAMADASSGA